MCDFLTVFRLISHTIVRFSLFFQQNSIRMDCESPVFKEIGLDSWRFKVSSRFPSYRVDEVGGLI